MLLHGCDIFVSAAAMIILQSFPWFAHKLRLVMLSIKKNLARDE